MCRRRTQAGRCGRGSVLGPSIASAALTTIAQSGPRSGHGGQTTGVAFLTGTINNHMIRRDRKVDETKSDSHPPTYVDALEDKTPAPPAYSEQPRTPHQAFPVSALETDPSLRKAPFTLPSSIKTNTTFNPQITVALDTLLQVLDAYRSGAGRKFSVRRARKALLNELYRAEVARREAMRGGAYLRCRERSTIWEELTEGLGEEIWALIESAKNERRK